MDTIWQVQRQVISASTTNVELMRVRAFRQIFSLSPDTSLYLVGCTRYTAQHFRLVRYSTGSPLGT